VLLSVYMCKHVCKCVICTHIDIFRVHLIFTNIDIFRVHVCYMWVVLVDYVHQSLCG